MIKDDKKIESFFRGQLLKYHLTNNTYYILKNFDNPDVSDDRHYSNNEPIIDEMRFNLKSISKKRFLD